jgi:hypothetical protein
MRTILKIFFLLITLGSTAQVDTMTLMKDHFKLEKKCKGSKCKYWVDNKLVSQADYEKHSNEPSISTCTPCYLRRTDAEGNLYY